MPRLEVAPSELLDKLTILELKVSRVPKDQVAPVREALRHVQDALAEVDIQRVRHLVDELLDLNTDLWEAWDTIQHMVSRGDRGPEFVDVAAQVPTLNDRRAFIKRQIDAELRYRMREVKYYGYRARAHGT